MEVAEELYRWLRSVEEELPASKSLNGRVTVRGAAAETIANGRIAFKVAARHMPNEDSQSAAANSPQSWWQTAFSYIDTSPPHSISDPTKAAVLSGDLEAAITVLTTLWELDLEESLGRRREGAVSLPSLDPRKPLAHSKTCLEFLLLSFCGHFGLNAQQAAGLLTQGNKYLAFVLGKGLKGSFQTVVEWGEDVTEHIGVLVSCLKTEREALPLILSAFRPGLLSREVRVVQLTAAILTEVSKAGEDRPDSLWTWFTSDLGGVDASVLAAKRFGKDVIPGLSEMLLSVSTTHMAELLTSCIRSQMPDFEDYIRLVSELISQFISFPGGQQALCNTQLLSSLITACLQEAEASPKKSLRLAALNLASALWSLFPEQTEQDPAIKASILSLFKRGCRDKSLPFAHSCIAQLFHLMEFFYGLRNANAAVILNILTALVLDTFQTNELREFLLGNFRATAERIPSFPMNMLSDLVINQWKLSDDPEFDLFDLDFFLDLSRSPQLTIETAITLADILGRAYLSKLHIAKAVSVPFLLLAERFTGEGTFAEYLWRYCKLGLSTVMAGELQQVQQKNMLPRYMSQPVRMNPTLTAAVVYEQTTKRHMKHLVLELVDRCCRLNCEPLNSRLRDLLAGQVVKYRREKGDLHKGWLCVLASLGSTKDIIADYEAARSQIVVRTPSVPAPLALEDNPPLTVPSQQPPSEKSSFLTERRAVKVRNYSSPNSQSQLKDRLPTLLLRVPSELGMDWPEVEEDDRLGVAVVYRKYGRMMKQLFKYYSGSGSHHRNHSSFSHQVVSTTNISESAFSHLLRDLGIHQGLISKSQLISFLHRFSRNTETSGFSYSQFLDLLTSTALLARAKADSGKTHLPAVFAVLSLLQCFRCAAKQQFDVKLYDEPRLMPGDPITLRKLNETLQVDPSAPLPKGFHKVKDSDLHISYVIPSVLPLPPACAIVLELLDSLLYSKFTVHFIEPTVTITEVTFAMEEIRADKDLLTRKPTFCRMSDELRVHSLEIAKNLDYEVVTECGFLIDDLIYSVENALSAVVSQHKPGISIEKKRKMQEIAGKMQKNEQNRAENRRKRLREQMLEVSVSIAERRNEEKKEEMRVKREEE